MNRAPLLTTAAVAALALCPAVAAADSIVYVDGGNVWSATPDGSRRVQLTDGGNWHSPTQADDGTIAAVHGTGGITVMARDGRPLRTIQTVTANSGDGGVFAPAPKELSFSPDGTKIAYSYVQLSCPPASTCSSTPQRATFVTDAAGPDASPKEKYGSNLGVAGPEWATGSRLLVAGGFLTGVATVEVPGSSQGRTPWVGTQADVADPELSRDGKHLAMVVGYGADTIIGFYATKGDPRTDGPPPQQPEAACNTNADPDNADPSWSPDGMAVAWENAEGIKVNRFSRLEANSCATATNSLLSATGSEPDWGPADPPTARDAGGSAPGPAGSGTGPSPAPAPGTTRVAVLTASASAAAIRRGLVVRASVPAPGPVTVTLRRGSRTVATGTTRATAAGTVRVRLSGARGAAGRRLAGARLRLLVRSGTASAATTLRVR